MFGLTINSSFISALWPFSTLGWPATCAEDFKRFYPTTMLETGYVLLILSADKGFTSLRKNADQSVLPSGKYNDDIT